MSIDQFYGLIATIVTVGAVLLGAVKLIIDRAISIKMNGLPTRVSALELETGFSKDWRHDIANPYFTRVQLVEQDVKHLNEKVDIKRELDDLKRRLS